MPTHSKDWPHVPQWLACWAVEGTVVSLLKRSMLIKLLEELRSWGGWTLTRNFVPASGLDVTHVTKARRDHSVLQFEETGATPGQAPFSIAVRGYRQGPPTVPVAPHEEAQRSKFGKELYGLPWRPWSHVMGCPTWKSSSNYCWCQKEIWLPLRMRRNHPHWRGTRKTQHNQLYGVHHGRDIL